MAKRSPLQYARALDIAISDVTKGDASTVIANFVELLKKDMMMSKSDIIISEFERISRKKGGEVEIELSSARALSASALKNVKKLFGEKVSAIEKVKPELVGGVVVKTDDKIFDASIKTQLTKLNNTLSVM